MNIQKHPFKPYKLEEEREEDKALKGRRVFSISLNYQEQQKMKLDKIILKQKKDSTAVKQVWEFGHYVLHHTSEGMILRTILSNLRKNKRLGIFEVE